MALCHLSQPHANTSDVLGLLCDGSSLESLGNPIKRTETLLRSLGDLLQSCNSTFLILEALNSIQANLLLKVQELKYKWICPKYLLDYLKFIKHL